MNVPKLIALCGNVRAGKSIAAAIIHETYGHELVDDARPLRNIGMKEFDLTEEQVTTQAGKLDKVKIGDTEYEVREILGKIGDGLEDQFGQNIVAELANKRLKVGNSYVLQSVRKGQTWFWRKQGALVIEIRNPSTVSIPFPFDKYDRSAVHASIENDGLSLGMSSIEAYKLLSDRLRAVIEGGAY